MESRGSGVRFGNRGIWPVEQLGVGGAAECAFEAEGYAGFQAALDFVEQEFAGFDREFLRIERRKPARDFVGVEEARDGIELAEVGAGEGGLARAVGTGEEVEGWVG
jgi:hypothetical protein